MDSLGKNWWACSASELADAYASGECSPVDVVDSIAERIEAINPVINAFVALDLEGARKAGAKSAERWRAGQPSSFLDGVPISVKDNLVVRDMRSTWGSSLYSAFVPKLDELPIARLRAAGCLILGKTNCPEFTVQGYTDNLLFGPTRNPWDTQLTPGGSSGGAVAAVSAGLGPIAIATDGGGSIRRPCSYTGLMGLKPSRGTVARADGFPSVLHDFEVAGPIARTTEDLRRVMTIIGLPNSSDPVSMGIPRDGFERKVPSRLRILYLPRFGDAPVDPQITTSVAAAALALEKSGHFIEASDVRPFDVEALGQAWTVLNQTGLAWLMRQHPDWQPNVGPAIAELVAAGSALSAADYYQAHVLFAKMRRDLALLFARYDLILTPSAAAMPWPAAVAFPPVIDGQAVGGRGHAVFTAFVNVSGCPAINLPAMPSADGMPIGFQLVGPIGSDGLLCNVGAQYEMEHSRTPDWPALSLYGGGF
ncbi:MAG: putative glutamyl-tRNA(Gln) amidotransferase subunit [Herbaspirillum sp.]|jgi:aspartyl-tRNA(Asn)/glutamyl-tRNA(Gln) amidotransferase subunit A|nr:putative glutamyl-tRNA(Gln) amidotransferase subunit [Herbaspirillum sp.]